MAVDTSDLNSLDTKAIIEAIENQGTEELSTDDIVTAITALTLAVNGPEWTYGATDEELYLTDGNGGTDADVDGTERFTSDIDLTEAKGATIIIKYEGSCATDDLIVALYARQDGSWDGDEIAQSTVTLTSDGTEGIYTIIITPSYGAAHYRIGMVRSADTTTFEIDAEMRRWR